MTSAQRNKKKTNAAYSLLDQVVVSGSRFAISLLIVKAAGAEVLGSYGLTMSLVFLALVVQQTIITTPFANFRHRTDSATPGQYETLIWMTSIVVALFAGASIGAIGLLFSLVATSIVEGGAELSMLGNAFCSAAIAVPAILQVEFFRRIWLIKLQSKFAFILDSSVWLSTVGILFLAFLFQQLTMPLVFGVLGTVSFVALLTCIV